MEAVVSARSKKKSPALKAGPRWLRTGCDHIAHPEPWRLLPVGEENNTTTTNEAIL
jgi:hypothetical protein